MSNKTTPTPWHVVPSTEKSPYAKNWREIWGPTPRDRVVEHSLIQRTINGEPEPIAGVRISEADADLIVQAVNSYASLVRADEELARLNDLDVLRLQLPDGCVPEGIEQAVRAWKAAYDEKFQECRASDKRYASQSARCGELMTRATELESAAVASRRDYMELVDSTDREITRLRKELLIAEREREHYRAKAAVDNTREMGIQLVETAKWGSAAVEALKNAARALNDVMLAVDEDDVDRIACKGLDAVRAAIKQATGDLKS